LIEQKEATMNGDIDAPIDFRNDLHRPRDVLPRELTFIKRFLENGEVDNSKTQFGRTIQYIVKYVEDFPDRSSGVEYVKKKTFELIKLLTEIAKFDVNDDQCLFLHQACRLNFHELTLYLLQQGANVDCSHEGVTPLRKAFQHKAYGMMELLIRFGAFDHSFLERGQCKTILSEAIQREDIHAITILLQYDATDVNAKLHGGRTALMNACQCLSGRTGREIISLLLTYKADADIKDESSKTALMHACMRYRTDPLLIDLLLANVADIDHVDFQGKHALIYAMCFPSGTSSAVILNNQYIRRVIDAAVASGKTSLMYACESGDVSLVEQILEAAVTLNHRLQINTKDWVGKTALCYAFEHSTRGTFLKLLHEYSQVTGEPLDVQCVDNQFKNLLDTAVINNDLETVKLLLSEFGVQDIMQLTQKSTALMHACQNGNVEIVNLLLDMPLVDVNAITFDGKTALLYAFTSKHPSEEIIKQLFLHGAIIDLLSQHLMEDEKNCWIFVCNKRFFSVLTLLWDKTIGHSDCRPQPAILQKIQVVVWEYLTQYAWGCEYCRVLAMAYDLLMLNKYECIPSFVSHESRILIEMMRREKHRDCLLDNDQAIAYSVAIHQIEERVEFRSLGESPTAKRFKYHDYRFKPMVITPPPIVFVKVYYQDMLMVDRCYFTGTNSMQVN
jgi:ankyrin repeat protein